MSIGFIDGLSNFIGKRFHESRGYTWGAIVSGIVSLPGFILGGLFGSFLMNGLSTIGWDPTPFGLNPAFWIGLMIFGALASIVFQAGLYTIPVKHVALLSFLGTRLYKESREEDSPLTEEQRRLKRRGYLQKEGVAWYLPSWLGGSTIEVNQLLNPLNLGISEVLASDNVPVKVNTDVVYRIDNPYLYVESADPIGKLENEALDQLRFVVGQKPSTEVTQASLKSQLSSWWLNGMPPQNGEGEGGSNNPHSPDYVSDKKGLESEIAPWGLVVTKAQISDIRLPEEIEKANADKRVEEAQAISEKTEATHVSELITLYMKANPGLTAQQAADIVQTERGKASRIIISGNAPDLVMAGALAGGMIKPPVEGEKTSVPFGPGGRRKDQQKKG